MTAKRDALERLHAKLADKLLEELDGEFASPALYGAISKFLSDNNVKSAMDETESLAKLREKLEERKKGAKAVNLAVAPTTKEEAQEALENSRTG